MSKFLFGFLLVTAFFDIHAQSWQDEYNRSKELYAKESYDEALKFGQQALKKYQEEVGSTNENYAAILRMLSTISYAKEDYAAGLGFIEKEILIRSNNKDTTYAGALANQAQFQKQLGQFDKAITSLTESRSTLLKYYLPNDLQVLEVQLDLGIAYYLQNDFNKALEWLRPALAICDQQNKFPSNSLEAIYDLALVQQELTNWDESVKLFKNALSLFQSNKIEDPGQYSLLLSGLASSYSKKGAYSLAEENFSKAQENFEKTGDKTAKEYFALLNGRAANLQLMGKSKEAEELFNRVRSQSNDASLIALSLSNTAAAFQANKNYDKAEPLYREALAKYDLQSRRDVISYCGTLQNLAMMFLEKGDLASALSSIVEAKEKLEKQSATNQLTYLSALNKYALILARKGEPKLAYAAYKQVLQSASLTRSEKIQALNGVAIILQDRGQFDSADSVYRVIVTEYQSAKLPRDAYYLVTLNNYAASKQAQGQLIIAQKLLREMASTTATLYNKTDIRFGRALENLAILQLKSGDLTNAKVELDSAMLIYENAVGKKSMDYANGSISLGRYYQMKGDYVKAEPYLKNACSIIQEKEGRESTDFAMALNALGLLYQTLGNYRDATATLNESKSIIEKRNGKVNAEYSTSLQNLATLYQLDGKYAPAEALLKEAMAIDKQITGENNPQYAVTLQNLAALYQKYGKQKEAGPILLKAQEIIGNTLGKDHPTYGVVMSNLASSYQDQGDFSKAETLWKQSVELRKKILGEQHPDYTRSLFGLAGVYHAQHRLNEARKFYEPVVSDYLRQIKDLFPSLSEKEKSAFYAKIKPAFDSYEDFCVDYLYAYPNQKDEMLKELYNLQLATKAILFNASNKVRTRILASNDASLKALYNEWIASKEEIVRYYNSSLEERSQLKVNLTSLESKSNDLEKKLSAQSTDFKSQSEKETVTWEEVKQNLQDNEAAVEILRIKKRYSNDSLIYIGLIVKKTSAVPDFLMWPLGNQLEGRKFKYHRNTIKFHYSDTLSYRYFWSPLQAKLSDSPTIFISCDGVFNKVNFNSLFDTKSKRWVIDDFTIRQLSSTRELTLRNSVPETKPMAHLFGDVDFNLGQPDKVATSTKRAALSFGFEGEEIPVLPATAKEVDGINSILTSMHWEVHPHKKSDATEGSLKKIENPKLIHIATHGFFLSDVDVNESDEAVSNPLFRSGLLLAGAAVDRKISQQEEDGVLTAYEAMNLNLDRTDLVVLSACETGLGEVRNGEGVYGLQRSFMAAGARNVLMSLWQVDDKATQELMNAFYTFWTSGLDKHKAFREAQLKMKNQYAAPYFWGAFVMVGI